MRHHLRLCSLVVAAVTASAVPARLVAQQVRDTARLEELTVTATRVPTEAEGVVASQTVISGAELRERGIRFVLDALRDVPGAAVVQQGSFGGVTSLFLRGGESRFVKVLIDGVPVNQSGGYYDFSNLTTDNVERIEIVRGPASVLYGSDAVTGVVQVFTRRGRPGLQASASGQAGTFGSVWGDARVSGAGNGTDYSAQLSRTHSDGIYDFNNAYGNTVASARLGLTPGARSDIALTGRFSDNTSHFPTDFAGIPTDSTQFTFEKSYTFGLDAGRRLAERVEARLSLRSHDADGGYSTDRSPFGPPSVRTEYHVDRRSVDGRVNINPVANTTLSLGVQGEREHDRRPALDSARHTLSYYAQGILELPAGVAINAGARLDDNSAFGTFFTYRVGAAYRFQTRTRVRASVGNAYKAPSLAENYAVGSFETGNPALEPERSTSWEIGVQQPFLGDRIALSATYFQQHFRDLIQYNFVAPGEPTYFNIAGADANGFELGADVSLAVALTLTASYSNLDTEIIDAGFSNEPGAVFVTGAPLIRRPRHSGRLGARYRLADQATLSANVNLVGAREDVDFRPFPSERVVLAAYQTVDLAAEIDLLRPRGGTPGFALTLRVENAFDEEYESVVGYPGRGRGVYAGARVGW
jgi:vitamin B12 transporter